MALYGNGSDTNRTSTLHITKQIAESLQQPTKHMNTLPTQCIPIGTRSNTESAGIFTQGKLMTKRRTTNSTSNGASKDQTIRHGIPDQGIRRKMTTTKTKDIETTTMTKIGEEVGIIITTPAAAVTGKTMESGIRNRTIRDTIGNHTYSCGDQICDTTHTSHSTSRFTCTTYH